MKEHLRRPRLVNAEIYDSFKQWCKINHIPLKEGLERAMVEFQRTSKIQRKINEYR
jgi:hypothetical protein